VVKLPKFVERKSAIEDAIYRGIAQRNADDQVKTDERVLRASGIGQCPRRLWARLQGIPDERGFSDRILAVFHLGHVLEDVVIDYLVDAGFPVSDQQKRVELSLFDGFVRGHIDGIVTIRGEQHLLEIKTANERRYDALVEVGYEEWSPAYRDQIQTYMGLLDLPSTIVVVYNKNDSRIYVEKVQFERKAYNACIKKAVDVLASDETPPPRPYDARNKSCDFCRWCDNKEWCWGPTSEVSFDR